MASKRGQKDQEMAADLIRKGIWPGMRPNKPTHNNYPKPNEVGSAAYRRMKNK